MKQGMEPEPEIPSMRVAKILMTLAALAVLRHDPGAEKLTERALAALAVARQETA